MWNTDRTVRVITTTENAGGIGHEVINRVCDTGENCGNEVGGICSSSGSSNNRVISGFVAVIMVVKGSRYRGLIARQLDGCVKSDEGGVWVLSDLQTVVRAMQKQL
jgi:hypothetical protein